MNLALIEKYCDIHAVMAINGHIVVYYHDNGRGVVETNIYDEGEQVMFSCSSEEEFAAICEVIESCF